MPYPNSSFDCFCSCLIRHHQGSKTHLEWRDAAPTQTPKGPFQITAAGRTTAATGIRRLCPRAEISMLPASCMFPSQGTNRLCQHRVVRSAELACSTLVSESLEHCFCKIPTTFGVHLQACFVVVAEARELQCKRASPVLMPWWKIHASSLKKGP